MALVNGVMVAMPPPPGYVVDFEHPQRQYDIATYVCAGVFNFFVFFFVAQRLWTRHWLQRKFEAEDVFFVVGWLLSTGLQVLIIRCFVTKLLGVHTWELPFPEFLRFVREALYVLPIVYGPAQICAKMTLLLFYSKLSPQMWFRWAVWVATFVIIGSNVAVFLATVFPCRPINKSWDPLVTDGSCIDRPALFQATAVLGVVTDVILLGIPVPMVLGLRMPLAQKLGLCAIFGIGSITIVTSIIRLVELHQNLTNVDQSWGTSPAGFWIIIETNLCIMCAALPTLRAFTLATMPRWFGDRSGTGGSKGVGGATPGGGASGAKKGYLHGDSTRGPPTIGGTGGERQRYRRFDDEEEGGYGLETIVKPGSTSDGRDGHGGEDGDSEKGILQTRTTVVQYGNSGRPAGSKPPPNLGLPPL